MTRVTYASFMISRQCGYFSLLVCKLMFLVNSNIEFCHSLLLVAQKTIINELSLRLAQ